MRARELRQLTPDALAVKADELRVQIRTLRATQSQGKEKNLKRRRTLRHTLARVLTILSERARTETSL